MSYGTEMAEMKNTENSVNNTNRKSQEREYQNWKPLGDIITDEDDEVRREEEIKEILAQWRKVRQIYKLPKWIDWLISRCP